MTRFVTIPVNARSASEGVRAVRQELAKGGREIVTAKVQSTGPLRPPAEVALATRGATACFVLGITYQKVPE